jgi:hypothetical protein
MKKGHKIIEISNMREGQGKLIIGIIILAVAIIMSIIVIADPDPLGATVTEGASSRGTNPAAQTTEAQAGNVTSLNIDQTRITNIWQGFYGNVSGTIVLESAGGSNFYDWSITEVTGEVYATRNTVNDWSTINCTNSSQWEAEESTLNIPSSVTDGINETYYQTSHPNFLVGTREMTGCPSTRPYNSSGLPGEFWNVLLNTNSTNVVYTSILVDNSNAFDDTIVDFEILVPVDRDTGTATYWFYAELN